MRKKDFLVPQAPTLLTHLPQLQQHIKQEIAPATAEDADTAAMANIKSQFDMDLESEIMTFD